jgi:hypothetical protein
LCIDRSPRVKPMSAKHTPYRAFTVQNPLGNGKTTVISRVPYLGMVLALVTSGRYTNK